ncbi:MAG TPA: recombinase family protein [Terracidiphilus sp.]
MTGQRVGYVRVSTTDQNTERQMPDRAGLHCVFEDKCSGKDVNRPQLQAALKHLRAGDTLVVHSMDRLGRNLMDLKTIINDLTGRGVAVEFVKEKRTITADTDPMTKLFFDIMACFAEFERSLLKERQREGIAIARAKNIYKGRKKALNDEQSAQLKQMLLEGKKKTEIAAALGITRQTVYAYAES